MWHFLQSRLSKIFRPGESSCATKPGFGALPGPAELVESELVLFLPLHPSSRRAAVRAVQPIHEARLRLTISLHNIGKKYKDGTAPPPRRYCRRRAEWIPLYTAMVGRSTRL